MAKMGPPIYDVDNMDLLSHRNETDLFQYPIKLQCSNALSDTLLKTQHNSEN